MKGKIFCDEKKLFVTYDKEKKDELVKNLKYAFGNMIGLPNNGTILKLEEKLKGIIPNRKSIQKELKEEKERYNEHKILYDYLIDSSYQAFQIIELGTTPDEFINNQINRTQGYFEYAFNEPVKARYKGANIGGLNDKNEWDAGKIRAIRKRIESSNHSWWKKTKGGTVAYPKLGFYEDQMKAPYLAALDMDVTGEAQKFVKMSKEQLDSYLEDSIKYKEPQIQKGISGPTRLNLATINRDIAKAVATDNIEGMENLNDKEITKVGNDLVEDILHTEVRNIIFKDIPTKDPKKFQAWRNSYMGKKFFELQKFPSERQTMGADGGQYVLVPLHVDKRGIKYLNQLRNEDVKNNKFSKDSNPMRRNNENAYIAYRIPSNFNSFLNVIRSKKNITQEKLESVIQTNTLEDGFYTAQEEKVFPYDLIPNTNKPKKKFSTFTRGVNYRGEFSYQPPINWMPNIWKVVKNQREWNELVFNEVIDDRLKEAEQKLSDQINKSTSIFIQSGYSSELIEEIFDKVLTMGDLENNYFQDNNGNWSTYNSQVQKISKFSYGYVEYNPWTVDRQMREAMKEISKEIKGLGSKIAIQENIRDSEESDNVEKYESKEQILKGKAKLEELNEAMNNFRKRLNLDPLIDEDRKQLLLANRVLSTKHRALFTNKKERLKDRSIWVNYIDKTFKEIHKINLKTQALATFTALRNQPSIVKYLADELHNTMGNPRAESGFLGISWLDEESIAKAIPGIKDAEDLNNKSLLMRSYKTYANMGFSPGFTNNFQRSNIIIDRGFKPWLDARNARINGARGFTAEELEQQVRETGVLEPGNAMIDMLAIGMGGNSSNVKEAYVPWRDMWQLWKADTVEKFLGSDTGWDKVIENARKVSYGETINAEEIKKVKEQLYDFMHNDKATENYLKEQLEKMKLGFYQSQMNRLVRWRISWAPFGGWEKFTLKGGEEEMRIEHGIEAFFRAEELGMVDKSYDNWKYTDNPEVVQFARTMVYNHLFGMNSPHLPKMFRGGASGLYFQWKQYDWNQVQQEYKVLRNAVLASKTELPYIGGITLPARMMQNLMKRGKNVKLSSGEDKMIDKFINMFAIRATISMLTQFAWYNTDILGIGKGIQTIARGLGIGGGSPIIMRGASGMESVLVRRGFNVIMLAAMIISYMTRGGGLDVDDEEIIEDIIRDNGPTILSTIYALMSDFDENKQRAFKTWLPSYGPKEIITADEFMDFFEENF